MHIKHNNAVEGPDFLRRAVDPRRRFSFHSPRAGAAGRIVFLHDREPFAWFYCVCQVRRSNHRDDRRLRFRPWQSRASSFRRKRRFVVRRARSGRGQFRSRFSRRSSSSWTWGTVSTGVRIFPPPGLLCQELGRQQRQGLRMMPGPSLQLAAPADRGWRSPGTASEHWRQGIGNARAALIGR